MNFRNRVRVATSTIGTGTIALGQAVTGYVSFVEAGVSNGERVTYCLEETSGAFEIGRGIYTSSNSTLTRVQILISKILGQAADTTPISLSGSATVFLTASATDLNNLSPAIPVERFGAKGDGSSDDTAAFLAAVAAAKVSQDTRTVYVPHRPNGYVLSAKISIPAGVMIRGDNLRGLRLSRIKPKAGYSGVLFDTEGYSTGRVLRPALVGLHLDGSSTTLTAVDVRCQEGIFKELSITDCFTYGIKLSGFGSGASEQALNNHIVDNFIAGSIGVTEMFDAIFLDYHSADTTINRNYTEATKNSGIRSRGYNNKITNNHIYSVAGTGGGVGAGIYTETSADHDISQNYIELCAAEGVLMQGGGSDVATLAATITANVFRNIDTGNTSNGVIEISGSDVSAVSVTGNVVRRDAATTYATPYFVYFNGIAPALAKVRGNVGASGLVTSSETNIATANLTTQPIGYEPSIRGAVTQATSKTTGVTLDALSGQITMHDAALASLATVQFNVTNSFVTAKDVVLALQSTDGGTAGAYRVQAGTAAAGLFTVIVTNISGGSLGEALVINFTVIKG